MILLKLESWDNFEEQLVFDLDIYHILKQYFKNPQNLKRIKILSKEKPLTENKYYY